MPDRGQQTRTIPLVEEGIVVEKRSVETGRVVVSTEVDTREELVEETLRREDVTVERVPVGRIVGEVPQVRQVGDVLIVPVIEEQLFVEKRLVLKEELHIKRNVSLDQVTESVTLRAERAVVTREGPENGNQPASTLKEPS